MARRPTSGDDRLAHPTAGQGDDHGSLRNARSGQTRWLRLSAMPLLEADTEQPVLQVCSIFHEITETVETARQLSHVQGGSAASDGAGATELVAALAADQRPWKSTARLVRIRMLGETAPTKA